MSRLRRLSLVEPPVQLGVVGHVAGKNLLPGGVEQFQSLGQRNPFFQAVVGRHHVMIGLHGANHRECCCASRFSSAAVIQAWR